MAERQTVTQFAVEQLRNIATTSHDEGTRIHAISTLIDMARVREEAAAVQGLEAREWHEASLLDLTRFSLKLAFAAVPAIVLLGLLYVVGMLLLVIGPQLLMGA